MDADQKICRQCGSPNIAPSRAKSYDWICSACANKRRKQNTGTYLSVKLASALRRAGIAAPYPGAVFTRAVYEKCGGASVISGETHLRRLCVVRINVEDDWVVDNAVLVTSAEAYALAHTTGYARQRLLRLE